MSEYRFMNQLIEKEHIPTPAYVFDLDKMKEFAEKVKRSLTGKAGDCFFSGSMLTGRISNL